MRSLPFLSVLGALAAFAALLAVALTMTGGVFEYPLDDVYIHLAMADGIARGEYGVNVGEDASADSSALYPFLLLPVVPPEVQRFLPLFWNVAGLLAGAWLWGRILSEAGYGEPLIRSAGVILALAGPLALNMHGVAFVGMEHALHMAATLAIFLGLLLHVRGTPNWPLLLAGIAAAPLLRFEGAAFALAAVGVLALCGAWRKAAVAGAVAVLPLASFCAFIWSRGIGPLPNSVRAKITRTTDPEAVQNPLLSNLLENLRSYPGIVLLLFALLIAVLLAKRRRGLSRADLPYVAVLAATIAHLLFGQVGWLWRYEHYAVVLSCAAVVALGSGVVGLLDARRQTLCAGAFLLLSGAFYVWVSFTTVAMSARSILVQQRQMQVFAKDYAKMPVAVNDLGWVVWRNPNYVLDLWGLASHEALETRLSGWKPGWAGPLAQSRGVGLVMIYDNWLGDAVAPGWVRLGELRILVPRGALGGDRVTFYATSPEAVPDLRAKLADWVPTLHPQSAFIYAEGLE